jgi:hypothetical protein
MVTEMMLADIDSSQDVSQTDSIENQPELSQPGREPMEHNHPEQMEISTLQQKHRQSNVPDDTDFVQFLLENERDIKEVLQSAINQHM